MQYALVNGASRGLGKALVKTFLDDGYTVFAGALKNEMHLLNNLANANLHVMEMDTTCENDVRRAATFVARHTPSISAVVNCAGILHGSADNKDNPLDIDMELMAKSMDVNVYGSMLVAKHFMPLLRPSAENISPTLINITSEAGCIIGAAGCYDPYSISKTTMNIVSDKMKLILGGHGIRVFAVHPGRMKTDMSGGNGDITPETSARCIADIIQNKRHVNEKDAFIDYTGQAMVQ